MGWSAFRKTGLTFHNPNQSIKGYTLFTPSQSHSLYLINMAGQIVRHWFFADIMPQCAKMLDNGHLLLSGIDPAASQRARALAPDDYSDLSLHLLRLGGGYTTLREYDFAGNLVWSYDNPTLHHDFHWCDNGDILLPQWVEIPPEAAKRVRGGYRQRGKQPPMLGDDIVRINRQGEEVARWRTWQMFDPRQDPINPLDGRTEWTHLNSLDLMPDGQLLISCRNNSRVALIDRERHEITWKITEPEISVQHHATSLPGGNIQIFDNGAARPLTIPYSRIIEVDPSSSEIVWHYQPGAAEQFFSGHISSAQRLAMGNVLICEGSSGRLFEITRQGEIVWEWLTPFVAGTPDGRQFTWIYRAYRYPIDHPAFTNQDLNPDNYQAMNMENGLA